MEREGLEQIFRNKAMDNARMSAIRISVVLIVDLGVSLDNTGRKV